MKSPPAWGWAYLVVLTLLAGCFTLKLPALPANLSVSETFVFSTILLFGKHAGVVTVVLDALVIVLWASGTRKSVGRFLFNVTTPVVAISIAGEVFDRATGGVGGRHLPSGVLIWPAALLATLYFLANAALVAFAMGLDRGMAALRMWQGNLPALAVNYFVGYCISLFIVAYFDQINLGAMAIVVPVLLISYVTFRTSIGRVEDANRHVAQLGDLYLSTVEALAMAVDAKDQITHGHIRRVQVFATELAGRLGVSDATQIRGIETAALLHDMGKLAIPEFILNKPGKLSSAEFEKMKRHADIGADLLSSISFPYPVIPIVRHHHENWDGSGYPSRLAGHDIPLGARILSVVDCFDALTSDRPYRPRLTDEEAFKILRERSGSMYDPLVVDTFVQVFPEIAPAAILAGQQARSLIPTLAMAGRDSALREIRHNAAQSSILDEFSQAIAHSGSLSAALGITERFISLISPASTAALYIVSTDKQESVCVWSTEDNQHALLGLAIGHGERTTGWAIAHESGMANSPAALDLESLAERFQPPLRSTLVAPISRAGRVVGALSVYSVSATPFTDSHLYAVERVGAILDENFELDQLLPQDGRLTAGHRAVAVVKAR